LRQAQAPAGPRIGAPRKARPRTRHSRAVPRAWGRLPSGGPPRHSRAVPRRRARLPSYDDRVDRSLLLTFIHDLGVHDVLLFMLGTVVGRAVTGRRALGRSLLLGLLIHGLRDLVEGRLERLGLGLYGLGILGGQRLAHFLDRRLDLLLGGRVDRVAQVGELLLGLVGRVLAVVAGLRQLTLTAVVLGVRLGVGDHPLDLVLGQPGAGLDLDLLLLAGAQILGRHVQ